MVIPYYKKPQLNAHFMLTRMARKKDRREERKGEKKERKITSTGEDLARRNWNLFGLLIET